MSRLPPWRPVLGLTLVALLAILLADPQHTTLQSSSTASGFDLASDDGTAGAVMAGVLDIVFAAGYATLGVCAFVAWGTGWWRVVGLIASISAGLADVVENLALLRSLTRDGGATQGLIGVMSTAGVVKWVLVCVAVLLLVAQILLRRRHRQRS